MLVAVAVPHLVVELLALVVMAVAVMLAHQAHSQQMVLLALLILVVVEAVHPEALIHLKPVLVDQALWSFVTLDRNAAQAEQ
jgi:hypothetical protein